MHSSTALQDADTNNEFGSWRNVWLGKVSSGLFSLSPRLWVWYVNLPPLHRMRMKRLKKHFPNLR